MLDGNFAKGCPALEKSYELDPLPGVLFTAAACFERWGKTHTAMKKYERFVELHEQRGYSHLLGLRKPLPAEGAAHLYPWGIQLSYLKGFLVHH